MQRRALYCAPPARMFGPVRLLLLLWRSPLRQLLGACADSCACACLPGEGERPLPGPRSPSGPRLPRQGERYSLPLPAHLRLLQQCLCSPRVQQRGFFILLRACLSVHPCPVVSCGTPQVYLLAAEGIAFRFLPDPVQVRHALKVKEELLWRLMSSQAVTIRPLLRAPAPPCLRASRAPSVSFLVHGGRLSGQSGSLVCFPPCPCVFSTPCLCADHPGPDPAVEAGEGRERGAPCQEILRRPYLPGLNDRLSCPTPKV